jgi:hypothetical protein
MAVYVTLDEAKLHLGETWASGDPREPDLQLKLDAAESALLLYLIDTPIAMLWTATSIPPDIKSAILLKTGELWRFRGDDTSADAPERGIDLSPAIESLLRRYLNHAV